MATIKVLEYLMTIGPKTEDEMVDEIKTFIENEEFDLKTLKKKITDISQPYDYTAICEDILKRFGIVYKVADIKKLIAAANLIPH